MRKISHSFRSFFALVALFLVLSLATVGKDFPSAGSHPQEKEYMGNLPVVDTYVGKMAEVYIHSHSYDHGIRANQVYADWKSYHVALKELFGTRSDPKRIKMTIHVGYYDLGGGKCGYGTVISSYAALYHELFHDYFYIYSVGNAGSVILSEGLADYFCNQWLMKAERKEHPEKYAEYKDRWYQYPPVWIERFEGQKKLKQISGWFKRHGGNDILRWKDLDRCFNELGLNCYIDGEIIFWYVFKYRKDEVLRAAHNYKNHGSFLNSLEKYFAGQPVHLDFVIEKYTKEYNQYGFYCPDLIEKNYRRLSTYFNRPLSAAPSPKPVAAVPPRKPITEVLSRKTLVEVLSVERKK